MRQVRMVAGFLWLAFCLCACSGDGGGQGATVSSVLDKAVHAQGGREAYSRLRVIERVCAYRGQLAAGGLAGGPETLVGEAFDVFRRRIFTERRDSGGATLRYFDFQTGTGWASSPKGVVDLSARETPTDVAQLQIQFLEGTGLEVFVLSAGEGPGLQSSSPAALRIAGKESQDGRSVVVLLSSQRQSLGSSGEVELETRYAFDEESGFLLTKTKTVTRAGGTPIRSDIRYSRYEAVGGEIWLPRLIEMRQQGEFVSELTVKEVALMPSLNPGVELKPAAPPK